MGDLIYILYSTATGKTEKSCLDKALRKIGLENANIIEISSIIPEGYEGVKILKKYGLKKWGNKIYAVVVFNCGNNPYSGMGIVYDKEKKRGIILEVKENNLKRAKQKLIEGLKEMLKYRKLKGKRILIISGRKGKGCSLVIAIFKEEGWK